MTNNKENSDPCASGDSSGSGDGEDDGRPPVRYLQCPAGVTVRLLKKFLIGKFDINAKQYHIDILYKSVPLPDDYKLLDIAYIYSWKQSKPMRIFYRVMDIKYAIHRFDYFRPSNNHQQAIKKPLNQIANTQTPSTLPKEEQSQTTPMETPATKKDAPKPPAEQKCVVASKTEVKKVESKIDVKKVENKTDVKKVEGKVEVTPEVTVKGKSSESTNVTVSQVNSEINKTVKQLNKIKKAQEKAQKKADKLTQKMLSEKKKLSEKSKIIKKVNGKSEEKLVIKIDKEKKSEDVLKNGITPCEKLVNGNKLTNGESKTDEGLKTERNERLEPKNILNSPKTSTLDENEKKKSQFLNGFQLIPIKDLQQRKLEIMNARAACKSPTKTSPVSTSKTKNSPKKSSPKNSSSKVSSSVSPIPPITPTPTLQKNTPKSPSSKSSTAKKQQPTIKDENKTKPTGTKRPYSMANRSIAMNNKKAKLEKAEQDKIVRLEREKLQKQKIESIIFQQQKLEREKLEQIQKIDTKGKINQKPLVTPSPNNRLLANARNSSAVNEKRKQIPNLATVPVDKRTNFSNNPTSAPPPLSSPSSAPTLKSLLFDNCNLNIPSSLSITLTESSSDKDTTGACVTNSESTNKRQSPPVNMYIEIFKIPDENEKKPGGKTPPITEKKVPIAPSPSVPPIRNISPSVTATPIGPSPSTLGQSNLTQVVTSLPLPSSKPNFVVHTTGIQSLGRKTTTPLNSPPVATANSSTATFTPPTATTSFKSGITSESNKPKKILPKPVATSLNTTPFIPKLAESPKATTGFQKMFEEAIKRKEAMKVQQQITLPSVKQQKQKDQNSTHASTITAKGTTPVRASGMGSGTLTPSPTTMDMYNAALQTALDLSTPSNGGTKRALSPTTNLVPNKRITPNPIQQKKSPSSSKQNMEPRLTSPLPILPAPEKLNNTLALLNPPTNGGSTPTPSNNNISTLANLLNPNVLQNEFNLKNLAQLRHMWLRQLEFRKHLMQNNGGSGPGNAVAAAAAVAAAGMLSNGSGDTLMEFENYMKRLQQQAAATLTTATSKQ